MRRLLKGTVVQNQLVAYSGRSLRGTKVHGGRQGDNYLSLTSDSVWLCVSEYGRRCMHAPSAECIEKLKVVAQSGFRSRWLNV